MESYGDFLLQNGFQIWSPKDRKPKIMKKPQQLRVFLFETCLVFSKIVGTKGDPSDYATRSTYVYKYRMMVKYIYLYKVSLESRIDREKTSHLPRLTNLSKIFETGFGDSDSGLYNRHCSFHV